MVHLATTGDVWARDGGCRLRDATHHAVDGEDAGQLHDLLHLGLDLGTVDPAERLLVGREREVAARPTLLLGAPGRRELGGDRHCGHAGTGSESWGGGGRGRSAVRDWWVGGRWGCPVDSRYWHTDSFPNFAYLCGKPH